MKIHFTLHELLEERGMKVYDIFKDAQDRGKKVNKISLSNIRENKLKRLPLETVEAICYSLQVTPDEWIHIEGCSDTLIPPPASDLPISDKLDVHLKRLMKIHNWKNPVALCDWLKKQQIPCRLPTLRKIYNGEPVQIPLELVAGISAALEITPGSWLRMYRMTFCLHKILVQKELTLERFHDQLVQHYKKAAVPFQHLETMYHNRGYQGREAFIQQVIQTLGVDRDTLIQFAP